MPRSRDARASDSGVSEESRSVGRVSFFSQPIGGFPDDPETKLKEPPWFGPPSGVLPGLLPKRVVFVKNDQMLLVIDHFSVYPTGVLFSINLWLRKSNDEIHRMPWDYRPRRTMPDDANVLRFGLRFSNGQTWTNLARSGPDFENEPTEPVVMERGGGGGGDHWEMSHWLWPLPPPGDLTFVVEWPAYDISETTVTVDAQEIIDCAATAETVWKD